MKKQRDRQTLSVYVMSVKKRNKTSARVGSSFEALPAYHQMEYHPFYDFIFTFKDYIRSSKHVEIIKSFKNEYILKHIKLHLW